MKSTINTPGVIKDSKTYPGAMVVEVEHKISSTETTVQWNGPKIPPDEWKKVLAYFHWVWSTTHSECQVRWFVNLETRTWSAWAFPQEARTGMTAREVQGPEFDKQRVQFPDSEGWNYWGTEHHHCMGSAFQSGTDEFNEKNQDGLHITIGNMGNDHYDIDCRFYLNKVKFAPDMSVFWDIGDEVRRLIPPEMHHKVACHQMCQPSTDATFPDLWKTNLIEIKSTVTLPGVIGQSYYKDLETIKTGTKWQLPGGQHHDLKKPNFNLDAAPLWRRAEMACDHLMEWAGNEGMDYRDLYQEVEWHHKDQMAHLMCKVASLYRVDLGEIWRQLLYQEPSKYKALLEKVIEDARAQNRVAIKDGNGKKGKKGRPKELPEETGGPVGWPTEYY